MLQGAAISLTVAVIAAGAGAPATAGVFLIVGVVLVAAFLWTMRLGRRRLPHAGMTVRR
jgi:hypothetical protein